MADPCATILQAITNLQNQRDRLQETLDGLDAGDPRAFSLRRQIKAINDQLFQEKILLNNCRTNAANRPGPSNLVIAFTERTQAIQDFSIPYYNYPVIGNLPSNNSVPMIAGKSTLLRLYLDAHAYYNNQPVPTSATGTITLQLAGGPVTIKPLNKNPVVTKRVNSINQLDLSQTLNFLIPPAWCKGALTYTAHIEDPNDASQSFDSQQTINFSVVPVVKLHIVFIHYTGLNFNDQPVDAVTNPADALICINEMLNVYPISDVVADGCETMEWDRQLKISDNWDSLLDAVKELKDNSGSNAIYLGLIPAAAQCGGTCGLGDIGGGVCVFFAGPGSTPIDDVIHEMGHALGRKHAPECLPDGDEGDTDYPQYGVFPRASIGGIGIDLRNMTVKDPAIFRDYMSYCSPTWTSLYGYMKLYDILRSGKFSDSFIPEGLGVLQQYLHIGFQLNNRDSKVEIKSGFQLMRQVFQERSGGGGFISAYVYDKENKMMLRSQAREIGDTEEKYGSTNYELVFAAMSGMKKIELVRENKLLHSFEIADYVPEVRITSMQISDSNKGKIAKLEWEGHAEKTLLPALCFTIRYSNDGRQWRTLVASTQKKSHLVRLDNLPGGEKCRFQVMASAGLRTASADSELFSVPCAPRKIYVLDPRPETRYQTGSLISLAATAHSASYGNAPNEEIYWASLRKGFLGTGQQLYMVATEAGKDWIEVQVPDGTGKLLSQKVEIIISDEPVSELKKQDSVKPCGCP